MRKNTKTVRVFFDAAVTLAATALVGMLAYEALGGLLPKNAVFIGVCVTDVSMMLAALLNIPRCREGMLSLVLTALPVIALAFAGIFHLLDQNIPILAFVIYDFYLIYWYGYRVFEECHSHKKWG